LEASYFKKGKRMYKEFISPLLDRFDSETWHIRVRRGLHLVARLPFGLDIVEFVGNGGRRFTDPRLEIKIGGMVLENPLLVGAGEDKVGEAVEGFYRLGFAGTEVGTVLIFSQDGNPKPRQFMLAPGVCLNRLGFNCPGVRAVKRNLAQLRESDRKTGIIGVSLGKNKNISDEDAPLAHARIVEHMNSLADYFTINVSSPNTPGLRRLQDKEPLTRIVREVKKAMDSHFRKPLFVKIAPDLEEGAVNDVIDVVREEGLTGIIAVNTTINPDIKAKYGEQWKNQAGGLSGDDEDYRRMATKIVKYIYRRTKGGIPIIGVGGIKDAATALERIRSGASALQIVTAIRGEGPRVASMINRGIVKYMEKKGVRHISDLVGVDAGV
jgi:dihydroorotate dehydrogenase